MLSINGNQNASFQFAANSFAVGGKLACAVRNVSSVSVVDSKRERRGSGRHRGDWRTDHHDMSSSLMSCRPTSPTTSTETLTTVSVPAKDYLPPPVYAALVISRSLCG